MKLLHDYILVKECIPENELAGTGLKMKYDETSTFMEVEVVGVSENLVLDYMKYYQGLSKLDATCLVNSYYIIGKHLIIRRVSKTPYKDGLYFISFKDVIAVVDEGGENENGNN